MTLPLLVTAGYAILLLISLVISIASLSLQNYAVGMLIIWGFFVPTLLSLLQAFLAGSSGNIGFNPKRLAIKPLILVSMGLIGVKIFEVPATPCIIVILFTGLMTHLLEGIYMLGSQEFDSIKAGGLTSIKIFKKEFSNNYVKAYLVGMALCLVLSLVSILFGKTEIMAAILLGGLSPILFGLLNCLIMNFLSKNMGVPQMVGFNIAGFFFKLFFASFILYLSISLLKISPPLYIFIFTVVFLLYHHIEAFYSQSLMRNVIRQMETA